MNPVPVQVKPGQIVRHDIEIPDYALPDHKDLSLYLLLATVFLFLIIAWRAK